MSIIVRPQQLKELCQKIDECGRFALDLEFIPERTYDPELCLVQVATDDGPYIVDPVTLRELEPLWQRIADPNILVVLHAADQDLDLAFRYSGLVPQNIIDTQIAAGFAGFGYPVGYAKLLNVLLGVSINKTESFTDWLNRPLTEEQIDYALDDVRHLLPMYDNLVKQLEESSRLEWVLEECRRYCEPEYYGKDRSRQFLRIKGASSLSRRALAILRSVVEWRDDVAKGQNRPPRSILSDNILLELARRPPKKAEDIGRIRSVRPDQIRHYGQQVMEAIAAGASSPDSELPILSYGSVPSREDLIKGDVLFLVLKILCYKQDMAAELVATRDDLQFLLKCHREGKIESADLPLLQGWRKDLAGSVLLDVLEGKQIMMSVGSSGTAVDVTVT